MLRRILIATVIFTILVAGVIAFEVSGKKQYPAGAIEVQVNEPQDPTYRASDWNALTVGIRGRTRISEGVAWVFTKTQWDLPYQTATGLGLRYHLLAQQQAREGKKSLLDSSLLASSWARTTPDYSGHLVPPTVPNRWTLGPSAGLVHALAFLDSLTPGSLSAHLRIAATGELASPNWVGYVNPIGGLKYKMHDAQWVRADLIFVPDEIDDGDDTVLAQQYDMHDASQFLLLTAPQQRRALNAPGPLVLRVNTFKDAVDVLIALGGSCDGCELPEWSDREARKQQVLASQISGK